MWIKVIDYITFEKNVKYILINKFLIRVTHFLNTDSQIFRI